MTLDEPNNPVIEPDQSVLLPPDSLDVAIFRTNVHEETTAGEVIAYLQSYLPDHRINFDLDDNDRILRVAGPTVSVESITTWMAERGFTCEALN